MDILQCKDRRQFHHRYRRTRKLEPCGRSRQGELLFWKDDVKAVYRRDHEQHAIQDAPHELINAEETAEILSCSLKTVYRLMDAGKLTPIGSYKSGYGHRFVRSEVDQLRGWFDALMRPKEVRDRLKISHATLWRWRKKGLLQPVSGPSIDGFGDYLYRRDAVETCSPRFAL